MNIDRIRLQKIWDQKEFPVISRRGGKGQKHRVRLPFSHDNRVWLRDGRRSAPEWIKDRKFWEIPKDWFNDFVVRALDRYPQLYIIQPYREQEKCSPACMNAEGHECQCSCMGANHGMGNDGSWLEISETFATRWGDRHFACRLMKHKPKLLTTRFD